jgi:hypothetical protein
MCVHAGVGRFCLKPCKSLISLSNLVNPFPVIGGVFFCHRFIDYDTKKVLAEHTGFEYYTIGQKARLAGAEHKYYVVGKALNSRPDVEVAKATEEAGVTKMAEIKNGSLEWKEEEKEGQDWNGIADTEQMTSSMQKGEGCASGFSSSGDVYVVDDPLHRALFSEHIWQPMGNINWISGQAPAGLLATLFPESPAPDSSSNPVFRCQCKCRYAQLPTACSVQLVRLSRPFRHLQDSIGERVTSASSSISNSSACTGLVTDGGAKGLHGWNGDDRCLMAKITFDDPQRAITAGQILALYDGEVCLGGAVIVAQEHAAEVVSQTKID